MKRRTIYDCCLVICHGKSEYIFMENIKSNLKLKFSTYAKNKGDSSIQITGLMSILNKRDFKNLNSFSKKYILDINKGKIKNFKVFIIMDFDEIEYTEEIKTNYLNRSMFKDHFLYDYIYPIFNIKNFDDVMIDAGYDIDTSLKAKSYRKIFPGINGDYAGFKEIKDKLSSSSKKSNIHDLLDYLDNAYQNK